MSVPRHILFIDAYDSFTNNVVGLLETTLGVHVTVIHHDSPHVLATSLKTILRNFDAVVVGPGPGHPAIPEDVGVISQLWALEGSDVLPIFGVCLGFQSLALAYGASVEELPRPRHGIVTTVSHHNTDIFTGTGRFYATNYHSLRVRLPASTNGTLVPLAWDLDDTVNGDVLLAVRHSNKPFWGVQFHPESECTTATAARLMMANWWAQANMWLSSRSRFRGRDDEHISKLLSDPVPNVTRAGKSPSTIQFVHVVNGDDHEQGNLLPACLDDDRYHRVPPSLSWQRFTASDIQPTRLYEALRGAGNAAILLDSQDHPRGHFSILGLFNPLKSPRLTYRVADGVLRYGTDSEASSTWKATSLDQIWPLLQEALDHAKPEQQTLPADVPFWGGWMGYMSYEVGLETIDVILDPTACASNQGAADMDMVFVHRSVVIDHRSSSVVVQTLLPDDGKWMDGIAAIVKGLSCHDHENSDDDLDPVLESDLALSHIIRPDRLEYCAKVASCQATLARGDSYELCLTDESKLLSPPTLDPWRLYKKLRRRNKAPFGAFLELNPAKIDGSSLKLLGGVTIVGSSPERFLQWDRHGHLEFRPIKGTVKKGPGVTRTYAHAILQSSKEQAENLMIVDLIRHDLSGVVGAANCRVSQLMAVEEYETVYQLVSAIEGQLPRQGGPASSSSPSGMDVLRVSLPPGSMTGAPKKRSCEVLRDLEKRPRSVYSGVLGYMDVGGGGDFSVVIRTAFRNHTDEEGIWKVGAGGAVTIQSEIEAEFHEMETKAASVLDTMMPSS